MNNDSHSQISHLEEAFDQNTYHSANQMLKYRFLAPEELEANKRYPLVLFLHGAGQRGDDNSQQLVHGLPQLVTSRNRKEFPCFIVAPQCPLDQRWVEVDWTLLEHEMPQEMSVPLGLTRQLLSQLTGEYPVDLNRIYITGLSMGGYGTWDFILRQPDYFAAAIPICGGADESFAARLSRLPIWAFHGDADDVVPLVRTTRMIETLEKAGGHPKTTIYPGVEHDSWTTTYSNRDMLTWLFAQQRSKMTTK